MQDQSPGIRAICPTRWTVHAEALQSVLTNYGVLQQLWKESIDFVKKAEMQSRIQGVSACMTLFDFMFGIVLGELLLRRGDNLSQTLKSPHISAAEGHKFARMTLQTLQSLRSEENFMLFWAKVTKLSDDLEVNDPLLPRRRERPLQYEEGRSDGHHPREVEDLYRQIYYEALDLITNGIQQRFDQPGYEIFKS